eukprot:maker-scaffold_23-snap-gene-0.6-mRNA-1 protein AED:0.07 eAED:0.13 QI:0/0/0/1/0/0/3/0/1195
MLIENDIRRVDAIPLSKIKDDYTEHIQNLAPGEPIPSILISNMVDNMPEEFNEVGIGEGNIEKEEEIKSLKEMMVAKLEDSTLDKNQAKDMVDLMTLNINSWGIKQSNAQMSLLSPIEVSLKQGYSILRSDGYHLTVDEENFLDLKFKALEAAGIVERSTNLTWGHPVFVVEKKLANPPNWADLSNEARVEWKRENILNRYRMVANMIRLNKITVPTSLNLPNLERHGFDFLPTAEKDRDIFTLVTRRSARRMKGAPMGWSNTPALCFERVITEIINADGAEDLFGAQANGVIAWLDDLLVYSQSFQQLLVIFEKLLKQAAKKRVRFNLRKCEICSPVTVWCGREIRRGRWNFDPAFYDKILNMKRPEYRHQMAQLVYLANWISPNIPKLVELRKPFQHYANLGGKKLSEIEKLKEPVIWTEDLLDAYKKLLEEIATASKRFLSTYNHEEPLLLFMDSSQDTWSIADSPGNVTNDVRTLRPRPLIFLSGGFSPSEVRWHISSKELYPLIYSFERIGFLLRTHIGGIYVYTDHKALLTVVRVKENNKRIYWDRLYRWIIRLQAVDLVIFHISSRDNFVSDLLTRWAKEEEEGSRKVARCSMDLQLVDDEFPSDEELVFEHQTNTVQGEEFATQGEVFPVEVSEVEFPEHAQYVEYERTLVNRIRRTGAPETTADFQSRPVSISTNYSEIKEFLFSEHISYLSPFYPKNKKVEVSADTIAKKQKDLPEDFRAGCAEVDGLLYFQQKLVIPRSLLSHFLVKNHMDKCHPSLTAEKKSISKVYFHGIHKGEVLELPKSFRQRCLHCQREPHILRRPYNLTHLAKKAREILRADYLYVNQTGYILVLMDSCTRKLMLFHSEAPTAKAMADALLQWRSDLGFNDYFLVITDNGSHFSNHLLKALTKNLGFEQAFSVAYSPWTNGAVEVVNSAILRCIRSLTSQYRLHESEWPKLLTTISYIINNRPSERRLNKSPNELFLYYKLTTPLLQQSPKHFSISVANNVKEPLDVATLVEQADELRSVIESVQEEVYTEVKFRGDMENSRLNKKRKVTFQFSQGDYVLVSEYGTLNAKEKTRLNWIGPYQIINIVSKDVYEVESLLGKRRVIHASRLWFYSDKKPIGNRNLKALFVHNFQSLEINKLKKIQLFSSPSLEYKVRSLGWVFRPRATPGSHWTQFIMMFPYSSGILLTRSKTNIGRRHY